MTQQSAAMDARAASPASSSTPFSSSSQSPAERRHFVGRLGEHMAARYLEMHGYRILARNWHHTHGELDLVVTDGIEIIAVEVKTRASDAFGHPLESITPVKLRRLRTLISLWCAEHCPGVRRLRVDAVAILGDLGTRRVIDHRVRIG